MMSCRYLLFWGLLSAVLKDMTAEVTCAKGYQTNLENLCEDEDECEVDEDESSICGVNATCYNTIGSYYCLCVPGYQVKSRAVNFTQEDGPCKDIEECLENKGSCGPNATCRNIPGSYYCTCDPGFVASSGQERFNALQNVTCNDMDECMENQSFCGPDAECSNAEGSYYCTCRSGFVASNGQQRFNAGRGVQCTDNRKHSEDNDYINVEASGQQQFNPAVPTFLPPILWILMFYQ